MYQVAATPFYGPQRDTVMFQWSKSNFTKHSRTPGLYFGHLQLGTQMTVLFDSIVACLIWSEQVANQASQKSTNGGFCMPSVSLGRFRCMSWPIHVNLYVFVKALLYFWLKAVCSVNVHYKMFISLHLHNKWHVQSFSIYVRFKREVTGLIWNNSCHNVTRAKILALAWTIHITCGP